MSTVSTHKHHKGLLVTLIIGCQALCFGGGLYVTISWVQKQTAFVLKQHVNAANFRGLDSQTTYGSSEDKLQSLIDEALAPIKQFGLVLTSVLTCLGALACVLVIRHFENSMVQENQDLEHIIEERTQDLVRTRDAVILGLAKFAEFRDLSIGRHLDRIGRYVRILGECLRDEEPQKYPLITDDWIHDLSVGSVLHDTGKVGIPDHVLLKPGKLSYDERALIEDHPIIGGECLSAMEEELGDSNLLTLAREMAYSHHEWWNGTGYPFKLQGEEIPLAARILALADVYDALTTSRSYKGAMPHERAREIIVGSMGTQFDPFVIGAFLLREEEFRQIAEQSCKSDLEYQTKCDVIGEEVDLMKLDRVR